MEFITIEFDPRCSTCQPEDCLLIYGDDDYAKKLGPALSGAVSTGNWPKSPLIIPGRNVLIEFQTATDYLKADNSLKFGFSCRVSGHVPASKPPSYSYELLKSFAYTAASFAATALQSSYGSPASKFNSPLLRHGLKQVDTADKDPAQEFLSDFTNCISDETPGARLARWLESDVAADLADSPNPDRVAINCASRHLYAAILWHLRIVDDARTVAAYLRFHQTKLQMPRVLSLLYKLWNKVHQAVESTIQQPSVSTGVVGLEDLFEAPQAADESTPAPASASTTEPASSSAPSSSSSSSSAAPSSSSASQPSAHGEDVNWRRIYEEKMRTHKLEMQHGKEVIRQ